MKKRFLSVFMAVCMLVSLGSVSKAVTIENKTFVFDYDQREIVVCGDLDTQKAKSIADSLVGEEVVAPRSILCIFCHNLAKTTVFETLHRYYTSSPRCLRNTYDATYCTRCNYSVGTLIAQSRIACCS